jgi:MFS family permease
MRQEIKRAYVLLSAAFVANMGIGILNFSLVFYMRDVFNSTASEIGWFSSIWAFSYFIGCFTLHKLSRKIGAHRSIAFAALGMAFVVVTMQFSTTVILMFVLYGLFGFITALFWPPLMGWISEGFEGHELNRMMGFFNLSWSTGLVISPYLGGLLLESNLSYPLVFAAGLYGLLTVALFLVPILFSSIVPQRADSKIDIPVSDSSTSLRYIAWLGNFTGYIIFGVLMFVFPLYAREELLFAESSIGLLLLFRALFSTFIFVFAGKMSWWHFNKTYMAIMQLLMVVFALFIPYIESWTSFAAALSLFGIIFAAQYSSSIFHGVSGSIHREKRMAIHEAVLTVGVITGAIGGGEIYQHFGMIAAFTSAAAAAAFVLILQIVLLVIQYKNKLKLQKQ